MKKTKCIFCESRAEHICQSVNKEGVACHKPVCSTHSQVESVKDDDGQVVSVTKCKECASPPSSWWLVLLAVLLFMPVVVVLFISSSAHAVDYRQQMLDMQMHSITFAGTNEPT